MEENKLIMTTVEKNELLKEFLKKWPIDKLEKMTLEEYTNHNNNSFTYWLEHITEPLGSIRGGNAQKFGIYAAKKARKDKTCIGNNDYAWCRKYGDSQEKAFIEVRNKVLSIATCARENKWEDIDKIDFGEAIKWKIAFLYSDKKLIPFFNKKDWLIPIAERLGFASDEKEVNVSKLNIFILSKKETNQDLFDFYNELVNIYHKEIEPTLKNDTTNEAIKTEVVEKNKDINFLNDVYISDKDIQTINALLERKKNIILQGAPGVGKTFAAKRIAYSMIGKKDENLIKIVQFHQNYSYEDFVEGYKPNEDGSFELKDGVFKEFCKEALKNLEECNKSEDETSFEKKFEKAYNKLIEDIDENDVEIKSKTGIVFNNIEIKPNNNLKIIKGKKPLHVSYDDLLKVAKKFKPQQEFSTTDIRVFLNKGCHAHAYWAVLNHIYKNYWSEDNIKETKPTETIEKKKYFFIIDEINRGNLSKIFGELLMLIEDTHRGETINLAYSGEEFCVPENVYIIGMMNTADRSLAMIDYALRRRFSFFEMQPAFKNDKFTKIIKGENLEKVVEKIIELNNKICEDASLGKGFCIGHSYFCILTDDNEETLQNIIDYEIAPMLKEYWFDDIQKYNKAIQPLKELFKNDNLQEHSN